MPVTIKELHIKINVQEDKQSSTSGSKTPQKNKEQILQECISEVMALQKRKEER
tara:strand:+ start:822 stop:983 length:162 start_codon:yes stop_codon:yes gene_type:complete